MPFGSYQGNSKEAVASAIRIMKETGADCVKMEGGEEIRESIERILSAGIPVMGHLGLTPQSINKFGTYTVRAKEEAEAQKLIKDAQHSYNRYRSRKWHRRTSLGNARYVRNQQRLLSKISAQICRSTHSNNRSRTSIY